MNPFGFLDSVGDLFDTVRFGAGTPETSGVRYGAPLPTSVPPLVEGSRLEGLPALFRLFGSLPAHEVEAALRPIQAQAAAQVSAAIEQAPSAVFKAVRDTIDKATEATVGSDDPLLLAVRRALVDPRSAQEAAAALDTAIRRISIRPSVVKLVNGALEVLEAKGALGSGTLHTLGVLGLAALGVGGATVVTYLTGNQVMLGTKGISRSVDRIGDVSIGLDNLGRYVGSLRVHDPAWAGKAIEIVVSGSEKTIGTDAKARTRLPSVTTTGTFPVVQRPNTSFSVRPSAGVDLQGKEAQAHLEGLLSTAKPGGLGTSSTLGVGGTAGRSGSSLSADASFSVQAPLDVRKRTSIASTLSGGATARVDPAGRVTPEGQVKLDTTLRF
jgi:hypothetical protein